MKACLPLIPRCRQSSCLFSASSVKSDHPQPTALLSCMSTVKQVEIAGTRIWLGVELPSSSHALEEPIRGHRRVEVKELSQSCWRSIEMPSRFVSSPDALVLPRSVLV